MSSIAYVTDENMLEYHRLCRNKTILFWRLANKKKFTDFRKGDLLFFFAKPNGARKKGLVGYAHFDSVERLSLKQMWDKHGQATGYDSYELLSEAISRAAKGDIPKQMSCLYLTDVVFFLSVIYPEEVGIEIPSKLESYTYLDRNDPSVTVEILRKAAEHGIDLWSSDDAIAPDVIFAQDEIRHQIAAICRMIGKESYSEKERKTCYKLAKDKCEEEGWELVRGSKTDCIRCEGNTIYLSIPFAYQANDKDLRVRELMGKVQLYFSYAKKFNLQQKIQINILGDVPEEIRELVEGLND